MIEKDKISIVVPVYNVEEFLPRCVESILKQSYKNLEILLIDDGSTDNSGTLCDNYAKNNQNIRVYHKKNGGLSDARNYGIEKATGNYIAFIDSDDYIAEDYCKILYNNLIKYEADISICAFIKTDGKNDNIEENKEQITTYTGIDKQKNILNHMNTITTVAWNKLYRKEMWDNLRYPKGKINEDEFVVHYLMHKAKKVVYTNIILYYYYQRANSIMKKKFSSERFDVIDAFQERWQFYKEHKEYKELEGKAYCLYMKMIISNYILSKKNKLQNDKKKLLERYREEYKNKKMITNIKEKIKLSSFYFLPEIYSNLKVGIENVRKNIKKSMSK